MNKCPKCECEFAVIEYDSGSKTIFKLSALQEQVFNLLLPYNELTARCNGVGCRQKFTISITINIKQKQEV